MGSLGGGCTEQNHGGVGSVFFSDQGTLAKVECQSSSISLFPVFVYFTYKLSDSLSCTKNHRVGKIPLLVCMSWICGEMKGGNQPYESHTQCFGLEALLSVCLSTGILQITFLRGECLVCLYTVLKI